MKSVIKKLKSILAIILFVASIAVFSVSTIACGSDGTEEPFITLCEAEANLADAQETLSTANTNLTAELELAIRDNGDSPQSAIVDENNIVRPEFANLAHEAAEAVVAAVVAAAEPVVDGESITTVVERMRQAAANESRLYPHPDGTAIGGSAEWAEINVKHYAAAGVNNAVATAAGADDSSVESLIEAAEGAATNYPDIAALTAAVDSAQEAVNNAQRHN